MKQRNEETLHPLTSRIEMIPDVVTEEIQPLSIESPVTIRRQRLRHRVPFIFLIALVFLFGCFVEISRRYENKTSVISTSDESQHQNIKIKTGEQTPIPTATPIAALPTSYPTKPAKQFTPQKVTKQDGIMYEIIGEKLYHDKSHFTQGLTYSKESKSLFESNGLFGQSTVCRLDPNTGENLKCIKMDSKYFAEGMQVYGHGYDEKLIQITWKSRNGFIYNATTLDQLEEFTFSSTRNEGWGICLDEANNEFIVSDGSNYLHFWDVDTLKESRRLEVFRLNGQPAKNINELEFVNGKVLANVWYEDVILVIDPRTGQCESEYDFSNLWHADERKKEFADVLNGISSSKDDGILYITGKKWDRIYKIKLLGFSE